MGTRSITHLHQNLFGKDEVICSFYRHFDGYIEGHGKDLANYLHGKILVNGIGKDYVKGVHFNRMGTLAVPLMMHIQDISGCEVIPTNSSGHGEEFTYDVFFRNEKFIIYVTEIGERIKRKITCDKEFSEDDLK